MNQVKVIPSDLGSNLFKYSLLLKLTSMRPFTIHLLNMPTSQSTRPSTNQVTMLQRHSIHASLILHIVEQRKVVGSPSQWSTTTIWMKHSDHQKEAVQNWPVAFEGSTTTIGMKHIDHRKEATQNLPVLSEGSTTTIWMKHGHHLNEHGHHRNEALPSSSCGICIILYGWKPNTIWHGLFYRNKHEPSRKRVT